MKAINIIILLLVSTSILILYGCIDRSKSCERVTKTFEYEGCSVEYDEIVYTTWCEPCGGITPCIDGFEHLKQFEIFYCLCENNKFEIAKQFFEDYNLEGYSQGLDSIKYSEMIAENLCKSNPKPLLYE